jgi:para-aminobenzoate synthetase/4-amino-4-deoxychorismate lyase
VDALAAHAGALPVLVDGDGLVLEAAYTNVWIEEGGALLTPPADGRLLPGVTRARILAETPHAREEPISLEALESAERVWLTSSIAGLRRLG